MAGSQHRRRNVQFDSSDGAAQDERQALLNHSERTDNEGCFPLRWQETPMTNNPHTELPVYISIHRIRSDIIEAIDDPYSLEQLKDPRMNVAVVRPLVDRYYGMQDVSIVYCLLVNKTQFLREHVNAPHYQSVNITRATLCELIANRVLRRYAENNPGPLGLLLLANILVAGFDPFQKAPPEVLEQNTEALHWVLQGSGGRDKKLPALEIAIISESKTFLSSSACQKVVNAIYEGRVVYTPSSFIDILPDRYKQKPISLYDPRKAPLLNQYRLIVPRTRNYLEVAQFIVLLTLYVLVMSKKDPGNFSTLELLFDIYCLGWCLDQFACILEHGWSVYTQNLWSFLDVTFAAIYFIYMSIRIHGLRTDSVKIGMQALDVLAIGAPVLVPRLAFNLMSENMLFVSLRAMMADFAVLTALAAWCFAGFLLSMIWLSNGTHSSITIAKWMLWVWFGLDGTGIQRSVEMHRILGPILMVTFAFLGNTLFLTILVSMLSNTFAGIVSNAAAEIQYRRSVLTLEGVKSDAIFAYQPPTNILALLVLLPLKYLVSDRWFHKINVAAVRTLNCPLLFLISIFERYTLWSELDEEEQNALSPGRVGLHRTKSWGQGGFSRFSRPFSAHGDIAACFDTDPPATAREDFEAGHVTNSDRLDAEVRREADSNAGAAGHSAPPSNERPQLSRTASSRSRIRRDSMAPLGGGLKEHLRDMLNEAIMQEGDAGETSENAGGNMSSRMEKLETAMSRMESMLAKLVSVAEEAEIAREDEETSITPLEDNDPKLQEDAHK